MDILPITICQKTLNWPGLMWWPDLMGMAGATVV